MPPRRDRARARPGPRRRRRHRPGAGRRGSPPTLARELQHSVAEDRPGPGRLSERALELGRRAGDPGHPGGLPPRPPRRAVDARHRGRTSRDRPGDHRRRPARPATTSATPRASCCWPTPCSSRAPPAFEPPSTAASPSSTASPSRATATSPNPASLPRPAARPPRRAAERSSRRRPRWAIASANRTPATSGCRSASSWCGPAAEPDELRAFAAEAVGHWTGAPVHAHAVAAGFSRPGRRPGGRPPPRRRRRRPRDLAGRPLLPVVGLRAGAGPGRRRPSTTGPCAPSCSTISTRRRLLRRQRRGRRLRRQPRPHRRPARRRARPARRRGSCSNRRATPTGVSAPPAGYAEVRRDLAARPLRRRAAGHRAARCAGGEACGTSPSAAPGGGAPHQGARPTSPACSRAPGTDIHVLDLMDAADRSGARAPSPTGAPSTPTGSVSPTSRPRGTRPRGYHDDERAARLEAERQALLEELGRLTGGTAGPAQFANHPAERARKAVAGPGPRRHRQTRTGPARARRPPPPHDRHRHLLPLPR